MAKGERLGRRKKREFATRRVPDLGYYIVVTDAKETEKNYLYGLRDSLPEELRGRIVIKVSTAKTDKLVENCKDQVSLEPQYGEPWIVFDRDRVVRFDDIIQQAYQEGINVGWSNPCIETWFDAYFGQMHGYQESRQCWHRFAETYERRTGLEYSKADEHIYEVLNRYGDESKAFEVAENRLQAHIESGVRNPSDMVPATTLHHLVGEIRSKVESDKGGDLL